MKPKKVRSYCIVYGCLNNSKDPNLTFFTLPKDIERRQKWLKIVDRGDLLERENLKRSSYLVCSTHFEDSSMKIIKHLKENALPSVRLPNQPQEGSYCSEAESTSVRMDSTVTDADPSTNLSGPSSNKRCKMISAGATSSATTDPAQMPSDSSSSNLEVLSAAQSLTLPVENIKKESTDNDSRSSFNAASPGAEDPLHEVANSPCTQTVKMEDDGSDDEKDISLKQTIRDIATQLNALKDNDNFDAFGRYVASVMRSLPLHRAMAVQPKIVNLLVEAVSGPDDTPQ